jgi:hypothetical protein
MLSGQMPFNHRNIEFEIQNSPILFIGPKWDKISKHAKNFV